MNFKNRILIRVTPVRVTEYPCLNFISLIVQFSRVQYLSLLDSGLFMTIFYVRSSSNLLNYLILTLNPSSLLPLLVEKS